MKRLRFTIRRRIIFSFSVLLLAFSSYAIYSIYINYKGNQIIEQSQKVISPTTDVINDFILLVTRSEKLITNWVYIQTNEDNKEALQEIHETEYFELKNRLMQLLPNLKLTHDVSNLDTAIIKFEEILKIEKTIMNDLRTFEDYEDAIKKFVADETIESEILPRSAELISILDEFKNEIEAEKAHTDTGMAENFQQLINTTVILGIILLVFGILIAIIISTSIVKPIQYLRQIIDKVAKGNLSNVDVRRFSNDELGDMSKSVSNMASGFSEITVFAENIGNGKYDSDFKPLSEEDMLGNALLEMRDNLKKVADEDKKRNWATSGMAQFGDILRNHSDNFERLTEEVISNLVKYLGANQGAIFIIEYSDSSEDQYMELASCYAWDKKKFLEMKIHEGEGLAGQAWIEGSTIYLTDVPEDYVTITSGLGEANPKSILIVPLKVNDEIHGVIELASFKTYEKYEIEFIERVAESIASTISNVKVNERTQKLLQESTIMTEQMRAQEEEMRQNMEELQATQEKIQRDQQDRESREEIILNNMVTFELSKSFVIRKVNDISADVFNFSTSELEGKQFKDLMINSSDLSMIQSSVSDGQSWNGILIMKDRNGNEIRLMASIGMIPDSVYNDDMYVIYGKDISHLAKEELE